MLAAASISGFENFENNQEARISTKDFVLSHKSLTNLITDPNNFSSLPTLKFPISTKCKIKIPKHKSAFSASQLIISHSCNRDDKETKYLAYYSKYISPQDLTFKSPIQIVTSGPLSPFFQGRIFIQVFNPTKIEIELPANFPLAYLHLSPYLDCKELFEWMRKD